MSAGPVVTVRVDLVDENVSVTATAFDARRHYGVRLRQLSESGLGGWPEVELVGRRENVDRWLREHGWEDGLGDDRLTVVEDA